MASEREGGELQAEALHSGELHVNSYVHRTHWTWHWFHNFITIQGKLGNKDNPNEEGKFFHHEWTMWEPEPRFKPEDMYNGNLEDHMYHVNFYCNLVEWCQVVECVIPEVPYRVNKYGRPDGIYEQMPKGRDSTVRAMWYQAWRVFAYNLMALHSKEELLSWTDKQLLGEILPAMAQEENNLFKHIFKVKPLPPREKNEPFPPPIPYPKFELPNHGRRILYAPYD